MLTIVGDDEQDIIELPNGMTIHMEFSIDKTGPWGWRGRIKGRYRRIQLYDSSNNLISELIEENPLYQPDVHVNIVLNECLLLKYSKLHMLSGIKALKKIWS